MKKFLSLVLALVMTMSLVTISAGAEDFADDDTIDYKEAVDVISAIGIVDGYSDDSFRPDGALTRGAAAKIICNLILGPTTASALRATTAPFKDVPTTNVFAGYITYCAQQGIISGYGDGTFRPTGALSGNAFMKMLLGALGYSSSKEGYTGANWQINVIKQAANIGLDDGNDEFVGSNAVTRQEAALYAFNMLQADLVEYPDDTIITAGDVTVTTQGTYKSVQWGSSADADGNIDDDDYVQFAERYFNRLVKTSGTTDDFMRPATKWTWRGSSVGTYAETADVTYSGDVRLGQIYSDLGMTERDNAAEVYVDGEQAADNANVSRGNDMKVSDVHFVGTTGCDVGTGTRIEAFRDSSTNEVTIVAINYYPAEVNRVVAATASKDAYITLSAFSGPATGSDEFETEGFDNDEVVYYTYAQGDIQSVEAAESVEGTLDRKVAGKKIALVGGNEYSFANQYAVMGSAGNDSAMTTGSDYIVYLDPYGNAIYVEESEYNIADFAYLRGLEGTSTLFGSNRASLLTYDGKIRTVTTAEDYSDDAVYNEYAHDADGYVDIGTPTRTSSGITYNGSKIVIARENSSGEYRLRDVATVNYDDGTGNGFEMRNGRARINLTATGLAGNGRLGTDYIYADSKTVFVVGEYNNTVGTNDAKVTWNAYTGISNAPDIALRSGQSRGDLEASYYCKNGTVATIMFIKVDTHEYEVTSGRNDVIFLSMESASKWTETIDNDYYQLSGVIGGEIVEDIKVSETMFNSLSTTLYYKESGESTYLISGGYENPSYDSDGIITNMTLKPTSESDTVQGLNKLNNENIQLGYSGGRYGSNGTFVVADDVQVYFVNDDGDITEGTINQVRRSSVDVVTYALNSDDQISHLFIQQYEEDNIVGGGTNLGALATITLGQTRGTPDQLTVTARDSSSNLLPNTRMTIAVYQVIGGTNLKLGDYTVTTNASGVATLGVTCTTGNQYIAICGAASDSITCV